MNKKVLFAGFLIFAFLFYWGEVRPAHAVKICDKKALALSRDENFKPGYLDRVDLYDTQFKICMRSHGIK